MNYDVANTYDYYEDAKVTSDCTCERMNEGSKAINYEIQIRSRSFDKKGTIGGNFCKENTSETRKCVCETLKK